MDGLMLALGLLMELVISFLAARTFCYMMELKKTRRARILLAVISFLITNMVIFIGDWDNLPLTIVAFIAGICAAFQGSLLKKATIGLMFASVIFAYNVLTDNFIIDIVTDMLGYEAWTPAAVTSRLVFTLLLMMTVRRFAPQKDYDLAPEMWRLLLRLTAMPAGIVLSVVLLSNPGTYRTGEPLMCCVLMVIACLSLTGLLRAAVVLARQRELEQSSLLGEMNRVYYQSMEQQHFEIRRLRHDMANHLQVLSALPAERKDDYIQKLLNEEGVTGTLNYCGDPTLNAVLTVKDGLMRQKEIRFEKHLDIPSPLPFSPSDLCAIFANALDNGTEACEKLPPPRREVILEARAAKGLLAVCVKNPTDQELEPGRMPRTSKKDKVRHGFGLRSIEEIVKRNQGDMELKTENGYFTLFLYLPLPETDAG